MSKSSPPQFFAGTGGDGVGAGARILVNKAAAPGRPARPHRWPNGGPPIDEDLE
jgi:hypothetical protein